MMGGGGYRSILKVSSEAHPCHLTCAENAMIATEIANVAPIVMTTAVVLWKEAMVPTMYDKLRVTKTCKHKILY